MASFYEESGHADKSGLDAHFPTFVERCFQRVDGSVYNEQKTCDNNVGVCTSAAAFYDFASVSEMGRSGMTACTATRAHAEDGCNNESPADVRCVLTMDSLLF